MFSTFYDRDFNPEIGGIGNVYCYDNNITLSECSWTWTDDYGETCSYPFYGVNCCKETILYTFLPFLYVSVGLVYV